MTSSSHPEELFELERQASLSDSQRAERDRHLAGCASCRFEHGLRSDFAREQVAGEDDEALLRRAVQGALGGVSRLPAPRRAARWAVPSAVGAGLLAAGLAGAALRTERAAVAPSLRPHQPATVASTVVPAPHTSPSSPRLVEVAPPPTPSASAERVAAPSAAQLFARANAARRLGDVNEALRLYRRLLAEHAASREARTSEVTMARLLLDTQGDAAEALRSFERYSRASPGGNLAEEALLGRSEALGRLGRRADEAAAWAALLERFPGTVHRTRAEARLREISP